MSLPIDSKVQYDLVTFFIIFQREFKSRNNTLGKKKVFLGYYRDNLIT